MTLCFAACWLGNTEIVSGQTVGSGVIHADYEASGFVTPRGMLPPQQTLGGVMQVGYSAPCDSMGSTACSGSCGANPATGGCGGSQCASGGIFGGDAGDCGCSGGTGIFDSLGSGCSSKNCKMKSCLSGGGGGGCSLDLSGFCIWCRGQGCSACQLHQNGNSLCENMASVLGALRPYSESSLCNVRWYDLSAEAVFLTHNTSAAGAAGGVTSDGRGGPIVLGLNDADLSMEGGVRVSGAIIFGPGSNLELTYMGGHEWDESASVTRTGPTLFSFISDFGDSPFDGFDDTDRSVRQSIRHQSEFHTAEINYRRRTMWPYCRFQGSWLIGLRYLRYNDQLTYDATGTVNNTGGANLLRFYESDDDFRNSMFGPQAGFDFWWNVRPGVSLGIGGTGGWLLNDVNRRTVLTANSVGTGATPGVTFLDEGTDDSTLMAELQMKLAWRISHSWTIRSAYYGIAVENVAFGGVDRDTARDFITSAPVIRDQSVNFDDLFIQGASLGLEYMW